MICADSVFQSTLFHAILVLAIRLKTGYGGNGSGYLAVTAVEQKGFDPRYGIETAQEITIMKKRMWMTILLSAILLWGGIAGVGAEILPARGEGQIGYQAVVLCESLTVRKERSAGSGTVKTLHYGDTFAVQDNWDGWASCFTSDDVDAGQTGWVNADYIIVNPTWYRTDEATPVYAWNDTLAPKVALLSQGTVLPILKDEGEWLIVSLRGASGWICKNEADRLTAEPLMQKIRRPDKAADEPAKGKALRYRGFFFLRASALKA